MSKIHTIQIPIVSHDFAEHINKVFKPVEITENTTRDAIMLNTGERKVVNYILKAASGSKVLGDETDLREYKEHTRKSLLDRILGVL